MRFSSPITLSKVKCCTRCRRAPDRHALQQRKSQQQKHQRHDRPTSSSHHHNEEGAKNICPSPSPLSLPLSFSPVQFLSLSLVLSTQKCPFASVRSLSHATAALACSLWCDNWGCPPHFGSFQVCKLYSFIIMVLFSEAFLLPWRNICS